MAKNERSLTEVRFEVMAKMQAGFALIVGNRLGDEIVF